MMVFSDLVSLELTRECEGFSAGRLCEGLIVASSGSVVVQISLEKRLSEGSVGDAILSQGIAQCASVWYQGDTAQARCRARENMIVGAPDFGGRA